MSMMPSRSASPIYRLLNSTAKDARSPRAGRNLRSRTTGNSDAICERRVAMRGRFSEIERGMTGGGEISAALDYMLGKNGCCRVPEMEC